jgi:hypothetical protein
MRNARAPALLAAGAFAGTGPGTATSGSGSVSVITYTVPGGSSGVSLEPESAPAGGRSSIADSARPIHEFTFARAAYTGAGSRRGYRAWSTDFPKADRQFLIGVRRLTNIDASPNEMPVRLDDPGLRSFPFLYAVEVGWMSLTKPEVAGLQAYLRAGGFLVVDDFWGTAEWNSFERQIRRVLPDRAIVEIPPEHAVFRSLYEVDHIVQVPNIGQGIAGGRTWERDGYQPRILGIFDEADRLMVAIVWNSDLGDAWEWADHPLYPLSFSTFAFEMGINFIVYGMSH